MFAILCFVICGAAGTSDVLWGAENFASQQGTGAIISEDSEHFANLSKLSSFAWTMARKSDSIALLSNGYFGVATVSSKNYFRAKGLGDGKYGTWGPRLDAIVHVCHENITLYMELLRTGSPGGLTYLQYSSVSEKYDDITSGPLSPSASLSRPLVMSSPRTLNFKLVFDASDPSGTPLYSWSFRNVAVKGNSKFGLTNWANASLVCSAWPASCTAGKLQQRSCNMSQTRHCEYIGWGSSASALAAITASCCADLGPQSRKIPFPDFRVPTASIWGAFTETSVTYGAYAGAVGCDVNLTRTKTTLFTRNCTLGPCKEACEGEKTKVTAENVTDFVPCTTTTLTTTMTAAVSAAAATSSVLSASTVMPTAAASSSVTAPTGAMTQVPAGTVFVINPPDDSSTSPATAATTTRPVAAAEASAGFPVGPVVGAIAGCGAAALVVVAVILILRRRPTSRKAAPAKVTYNSLNIHGEARVGEMFRNPSFSARAAAAGYTDVDDGTVDAPPPSDYLVPVPVYADPLSRPGNPVAAPNYDEPMFLNSADGSLYSDATVDVGVYDNTLPNSRVLLGTGSTVVYESNGSSSTLPARRPTEGGPVYAFPTSHRGTASTT